MSHPRVSRERVLELSDWFAGAAAGAALSDSPAADASIERCADVLALLNETMDARARIAELEAALKEAEGALLEINETVNEWTDGLPVGEVLPENFEQVLARLSALRSGVKP